MTSTTSKAARQKEADDAATVLRTTFGIAPGSVVWTMVKHVARSGMSREISVYVPSPWGDGVANVSRLVAQALTGYSVTYRPDREAVKIGGVGMDMGFAIVYDLSRVLFRDGWECSGEQSCSSNDHSNDRGAERVSGYRAGRRHSDPGYALVQRWMS